MSRNLTYFFLYVRIKVGKTVRLESPMDGNQRGFKRKTQREKIARAKLARKKGELKIPGQVARRAERRALFCRVTEDRVLGILVRAKNAGRFLAVKKSEPNSEEDRLGKDFTIQKVVGEAVVEKSFGVTISLPQQKKALAIHPGISCFLITPEMKDKTLLSKIDTLFPY